MKSLINLKTLFLLTISATSIAQAGVKEVGNGGDAVVCRDTSGQITSARLLDLYEGELRYSNYADLRGSAQEVALELLNRFTFENLWKKPVYSTRIQKFISEASFLNDVELVDVDDSNHIFFPRNCKVEQIVIQKSPQYPNEKRYFINNQIWQNLTEADRGALIFHEVLYTDVLGGESTNLRYLNSTLAANKFSSLDYPSRAMQYDKFSAATCWVEPNQPRLRLCDVKRDENGIKIRAKASRVNPEEIIPIQLQDNLTYHYGNIYLVYYPNGGTKLINCPANDNPNEKNECKYEVMLEAYNIKASHHDLIKFFPNGNVETIADYYSANYPTYSGSSSNLEYSETEKEYVFILRGKLTSVDFLTQSFNTPIKCLLGFGPNHIQFYEDGTLKKCLMFVNQNLPYQMKTDKFDLTINPENFKCELNNKNCLNDEDSFLNNQFTDRNLDILLPINSDYGLFRTQMSTGVKYDQDMNFHGYLLHNFFLNVMKGHPLPNPFSFTYADIRKLRYELELDSNLLSTIPRTAHVTFAKNGELSNLPLTLSPKNMVSGNVLINNNWLEVSDVVTNPSEHRYLDHSLRAHPFLGPKFLGFKNKNTFSVSLNDYISLQATSDYQKYTDFSDDESYSQLLPAEIVSDNSITIGDGTKTIKFPLNTYCKSSIFKDKWPQGSTLKFNPIVSVAQRNKDNTPEVIFVTGIVDNVLSTYSVRNKNDIKTPLKLNSPDNKINLEFAYSRVFMTRKESDWHSAKFVYYFDVCDPNFEAQNLKDHKVFWSDKYAHNLVEDTRIVGSLNYLRKAHYPPNYPHNPNK